MLTSSRRTKIVCTLGPASDTPEMMRRLMEAGMNVARLNFSHGDQESHCRTAAQLRQVSQEMGREIGILQDLGGPKIRLGNLNQRERLLQTGTSVALVPGDTAEGDDLPVNYPYLVDDVAPGDRILLADGLVELKVEDEHKGHVHCRVVVGGKVTSHKGVNLPTSSLQIEAFTEKDRRDLAVGLEEKFDFVALSFVRSEKDLLPIRDMIAQSEHKPLLIAKIEKPEALERIPQILRLVDGIMVARGDLGVETPLELVPTVQKRLIREARQAGKIVITATQMLRSMVDSPRPTRAEATDVANAVLDGTDAVMLSEETAIGSYPIKAVEILDRITKATEPLLFERKGFLDEPLSDLLPQGAAALTRAACYLARDLEPAAIIASTASGATARLLARYRTRFPVVGMTPNLSTYRQLAITWGVTPALIPNYDNTDKMFDRARAWMAEQGLAEDDQRLIITAGVPVGIPGTTNLLKVI